MEKYKRGQLVNVNNLDGVILREAGKEGYLVAKCLNGDKLFLVQGELHKRLDAEGLANVIVRQVRNTLPLEDYLEKEEIEIIKENIEEWLNEIR